MRERLELGVPIARAERNFSAILSAVGRLPFFAFFVVVMAAGGFIVRGAAPQSSQLQSSTPPSQAPSASQQPAPTQAPPAPQERPHIGPVIILDPAHGGADTGGRGTNGVAEKDITLVLARFVRMDLERQGFRAVLTRNEDSFVGFDDRAAISNAHRDAVFITIHIASTGSAGTVRAYFDQMGDSFAAATGAAAAPAASATLVRWDEAQRPYVETSHRFADLLQSELAQRFSGSPVAAAPAAVRGLRSISAPAAAIEISSVAIPDPNSLTVSAAPLAASIARSALALRPPGSAGAN